MELPDWTDIVKTATFKELAPYDPDWYYIRAGTHSLSMDVLYINIYSCLYVFVHTLVCGICVVIIVVLRWFICVNIMAASMARKIYLRGGLGVGAFTRIYGGSKRNGSRPPHFCKSSGAIARHILKQLKDMKIIDADPKG